MSLTSDSCGGFNPLVSLSEKYKTSSRYSTEPSQSSHSISVLLNTVRLSSSTLDKVVTKDYELHTKSTENVTVQQKLHDSEVFQKLPNTQHSSNKCRLAPWRPVLQGPVSHQQHTTSSSNHNKPKLRNKNFEQWVRRFHPEVLQCAQIDASLSHDLAEEWLQDFDLNEVLNVDSLTEAEHIVEDWIREFRLGQRLSSTLSFTDKVLLEDTGQADIQYEHLTHGPRQGSADCTVEYGIQMIKIGDVLSAISVFEELVSRDADHGEAWYYLGICHQQSENEEQAIRALKNVREDNMCYKWTLLALAASYINENKEHTATLCILHWVKLSHPELDEELTTAAALRYKLQHTPKDEYNNVEIQTCLGILSCIMREYDTAAACFKEAVLISPQDFMLWNRLGATLANANRSSESIEAYRRALTLCPGYTRARYNLGIACINLGANREGIEHFLTCLTQQETDSIWTILRLAMSLSKHYNLLESVDKRDLAALCEHFDIS